MQTYICIHIYIHTYISEVVRARRLPHLLQICKAMYMDNISPQVDHRIQHLDHRCDRVM